MTENNIYKGMIVDNVYDLALNIFVGTNFFEL